MFSRWLLKQLMKLTRMHRSQEWRMTWYARPQTVRSSRSETYTPDLVRLSGHHIPQDGTWLKHSS